MYKGKFMLSIVDQTKRLPMVARESVAVGGEEHFQPQNYRETSWHTNQVISPGRVREFVMYPNLFWISLWIGNQIISSDHIQKQNKMHKLIQNWNCRSRMHQLLHSQLILIDWLTFTILVVPTESDWEPRKVFLGFILPSNGKNMRGIN